MYKRIEYIYALSLSCYNCCLDAMTKTTSEAISVQSCCCIGPGPSCTVAGGWGAVEGEAHNVAERLSVSSES